MYTLHDLIRETGASVYCLYASSDNALMRYMTRFVTQDPVTVLQKPDAKPLMIVPQMEAERAMEESQAEILTRRQAGYLEIMEHETDPWKITAEMIHRLSEGPYLVPPSFPVALSRALEAYNRVIIDYDSVFSAKRAIKTPDEISWITRAQRAAEAAMDTASRLIKKAEIRSGLLWHKDTPLTSGRIRYEMNRTLLSFDCTAHDTIVACGKETSMPHCTGNGQIKAHEPVVIDIFPRDNPSGYYADMTRTFSRGIPSGEITELYDTVRNALLMAEEKTRAGETGSGLYQLIHDYFEELGYHTDTEGFIHSLGHGVGLEIHEQPPLSSMGGALEENNVITLEPGLYYRETGGVRLENMGIVKKTRFERLTRYPLEMVL